MKIEKQRVSPLSREGHWPAAIPDAVWAPLVAGGLILIAGLFGLLAGLTMLSTARRYGLRFRGARTATIWKISS